MPKLEPKLRIGLRTGRAWLELVWFERLGWVPTMMVFRRREELGKMMVQGF